MKVCGETTTCRGWRCENQNCCVLNICASRYSAPVVAGAVAVTLKVTLAPDATSDRSEKTSLVSHEEGEPPGVFAKCRSSFTGLLPPEGHVYEPLLVTVTEKVCGRLATQLVGAGLMS